MRSGFRRYAIVGHRRVQGWIEPPILSVVAALSTAQADAGVQGALVEIGVHHGRLFIGMLLAGAERERALAIDLFDDQASNVDHSGEGDERTFRANLDRYAPDIDVDVLSADSTNLDGQFIVERVGPVRFFDVDGGHTSDVVAHDMQTAASSVTDGGIVISDDVFNEQWPGAFEGTARYLAGDARVVPFGIGFNKTMFTTPDHAALYRAALEALADRSAWLRKDGLMYGNHVTILSLPPMRVRAKLAVKTRVSLRS